jgi:surface antigen
LCLLAALFSSSLATAQSWQSPAFDNWANPNSGAGVLFNITKWFGASLSKEDTELHRRAVYQALNNLENGEQVVWRNDRNDADGKVAVAYTWPNNGLVCRRLYSYVRINTNSRSYQDTACLDNNQKTWTFVDKY